MIKVMLVDDENRIRESISRLIPWDDMGLVLTGSCSNAVDALNEMIEEMPDILITDVKMPVMNGIELISQAKQIYPLLQCVIISGYDEFPLAQAAMMEGVKYYLLKPCMQEDVAKVLKKCMKEIERLKEEALSNVENRRIILDRLIHDMENLQAGKENLEILMQSYGEDLNLLREAAVAMVVKYWPEKESQAALETISRVYKETSHLYDYVDDILSKCRETPSDKASFVEVIKHYVNEHYQQSNLSLQFLADEVLNMDVKYVGKQFQKKSGIKFSDYLLKVRIEHAITMLQSSRDYRMYEIAEAVGLGNNVQYFYQLFKKYTGMTPREYKEQKDGKYDAHL